MAVLDDNDLVVEVHEYNVLGAVLDGELALGVVHDIVYVVKFSCFYLFVAEVNLQTPKDEALLVLLRLLKKDVDDVFDGRRNSEQLLGAVNRVPFLQLLLYQIQILDVVDFIAGAVEYGKQEVLEKADEPHSLLEGQGAHQLGLLLALHRVAVDLEG